MKRRTLLLVVAALAALVAVLVALDVISFGAARTDRWVAVTGFAAAAVLVVAATTVRARSTATNSAAPTSAPPTATEPAPTEERAKAASTPRFAEPSSPGPAPPTRPTRANRSPDTLDLDLQELIDDDEMDQISALVEQTEEPSEPPQQRHQPSDRREDEAAIIQGVADTAIESLSTGVVPVADEPLARIELRLADYDDEALQRLVKESEALVIAEMVRTGQLSSAGGLTEKDIASMVFLAYNSDEMLAELRFRKSLDQPGDVAVTDKDFAPLRNIE